jgi:3-oxoacyl-[acyl-carrier protein] reductase
MLCDGHPSDAYRPARPVAVEHRVRRREQAVPHLGTNGRIINIGSINADRVPLPGLAVYAMTKAAVAGLTRGLAREPGLRGITVNNIQPGPIARR